MTKHHRLLLFIIVCTGLICVTLSGRPGYRPEDYFDDDDVVMLITYVKRGNIKGAKQLMERGVSLDATNDRYVTPVYYFFLMQNYPAFKRMLHLGASPDVYPTGIGSFSLITYSMRIYDTRYFKLLLKHGVDLEYEHTQRNGEPPLFAALYGSVNIRYLKMLLEHGINVNNYNGTWTSSPLFQALVTRKYRKVILLLEYGTDFINNEEIKEGFIKELENEDMGQFKYTRFFVWQKNLVRYLKEKYNIDIKLYYPDGK